ncbi:MAG TPA: cytochrome c peroxidase [Bacteroidia bacterium]
MRHLSFRSKFVLALLIVLSAVACRKIVEVDDPSGQLTPYTLNLPAGFPNMKIPADNPLTVEGIALGKMLFFDPILSGDNTMSCATCHKQAFGFTDSSNRFSTGIDGLKGNRNSMPLFNLAWSKGFFWDAGASNMESQVVGPIENPLEMHENLANALAELNAHATYPALFKKVFGGDKITTSMLMRAVAQFERTMISGNSKYDQYVQGKTSLSASEQRGLNLYVDMNKGDCNHCHVIGGLFTDFELRNTGLDSIPVDPGRARITLNPLDSGKFKTPSLRNIEVTAPYMHDGRFNTLEECIEHYNTGFRYTSNLDPNLEHTVKGRLSQAEIADLVAFLKTLTDNEFLNNPVFRK